jgi:hypothetical protein
LSVTTRADCVTAQAHCVQRTVMAINVAEECKAELARTGLDAVAPDVAATAVELLRHVAPLLFNENEVRGWRNIRLNCSHRRIFFQGVPCVRGVLVYR